ncbi:flagellar protein FlgN [Rhodovibrio salinarum]|uniref:Flagellar protein FlgN n=1 Tax=Rhodovibrio salinarum TaxID=1087 RepID=A0A934QIX2_9PROT|nr:flagellar protein FlgN [Rhodovibrio salinarum]MBK1697714.1 flagellar protein FlgN [Rhodovibrio salinarum]
MSHSTAPIGPSSADADTAADTADDRNLPEGPGEPAEVIDLLETTLRLIDVLEAEIEMLRGMRPEEMQALQQDKIVLAAAYESQLQRLSDHPEIADSLSEELRAELKEATDSFQEVLAANERALRAAKAATKGVLKTVVDTANRQDPRVSYNTDGRPSHRNPRAPHAVSVDQRL